jgi:fatty acid-binding protein DegV
MRKTICQIVDSSGNLPRNFIEHYNISEIPFYFKFDKPNYFRENVDYKITEFYNHMEQYPNEIPKTSAPNIYDWLTVFEEQYARGTKKYIVTRFLLNYLQAFKLLFQQSKYLKKKTRISRWK